MPTSFGGVPSTGFILFIYSQFHEAPLGVFEAKVLGSQIVCKEVVILVSLALCVKYQFTHGYDTKNTGNQEKVDKLDYTKI